MVRRVGVALLCLVGVLLFPGSMGGVWSAKEEVIEHHHVREHHVPRIIHQSWKDKNVPKGFKPWQDSWKNKHPGWEYRYDPCTSREIGTKLCNKSVSWGGGLYQTIQAMFL